MDCIVHGVAKSQTQLNDFHFCFILASQVALVVKNPPARQKTQEMQVGFLDQEDPLEPEMATHSSILVWEIPWTEELEGYSPYCQKELDTTEVLNTHAPINWIYAQEKEKIYVLKKSQKA